MIARPQRIDQHILLTGRPPMREFLGFIKSLAHTESPLDTAQMTSQWRRAYERILALEESEADLADNPPINECPPGIRPLINKVLSDPRYERNYGTLASQIAMVELDRLVVFQKHINLRQSDEVTSQLGTTPSIESVFKLCFPMDKDIPELRAMRAGTNAFVFTSPSTDLRFLGPELLDASQVEPATATGLIGKAIGLMVGFSTNYMKAIHIDNRLVLSDGSHRAYALRALGITHAPCLIQQIAFRDELDLVAVHDFARNPENYLDIIRPPLLKDYFDPDLHTVIPVPRRNRQVKITYSVEGMDVPEV